ncbi:GD18158 [Drosophila simulans]|uniref:GD18158 n=1 Tax=Drosophila simulans TaxID=7240 RepID=B4QW01_DROSI|nr:GD18158 [Drosophila simulans]
MLHLRLFDSSLYYTLASASESSGLASSTSTERSFNGTQGAGGVAVGGESLTPSDVAAVNLIYFTPAISHAMLAPTTIATTTASATMVPDPDDSGAKSRLGDGRQLHIQRPRRI